MGPAIAGTRMPGRYLARVRVCMPQVTKRGRELAREITGYVEIAHDTSVTCSLIARHASTHRRYMEHDCNVGLTAEQARKVDQIETRIRELVSYLPKVRATGQVPTVKFSGDPRGYTVKIVIPGAPGNTWGLGGEYGV